MSTSSTNRLPDLETVLLWEGEIDNLRIRELFGVQPVWASRLLGELAKHMGSRAARASAHAPLRLIPSAPARKKKQSPDEYLRIIGASAPESSNSLFLEDARKDLSIVGPGIFAAIVQAMRSGVGVQIAYRSMSQPGGSERLVFPHALVRAPRRWHMRAWCSQRKEFRDFNLGRVSDVESTDILSVHGREKDKDWNETVSFQILAHPSLTPQQQLMIADEYFPGSSARQLKVRKCLLGYIIHDLRLGTDVTKHFPSDYQLVVHDAHKLPALFGGA
jgi:predicted DNA-binding transcriptional regulator YafY